MHRHPEYWSEPLEFRPERFLGPQPEPRVAGAFLPFGAGPRACVGSRFALQEIRLALVRMAQAFEFQLAPGLGQEEDLSLRLGITLAPKDGVFLRVLERSSPSV